MKLDLSRYDCIAIGGSAGSYEVFEKILKYLPDNLNVPVFVTIHVGNKSSGYMTKHFGTKTNLIVQDAKHGLKVKPGTIYMAVPEVHFKIGIDNRILLEDSEEVKFSKPSIDVMFKSVVGYYGSRVLGLLLTGANDDGAEGLLSIKQHGGLTIVQNPLTAKAPTMPQSAINIGANTYKMSVEMLCASLATLSTKKEKVSSIQFDRSKIQKVFTNEEFDQFSDFILARTGIRYPSTKKLLLENRIKKRLKELHIYKFSDYLKKIKTEGRKDGELDKLIDVVTTNKTGFYREPWHFDFIKTVLKKELEASRRKKFRIWCAAASTGQEPFTLAITCEESLSNSNLLYEVVATDISNQVLEVCKKGEYKQSDFRDVPLVIRKRYFDEIQRGLFEVKPELKSKTQFKRLNLMDPVYFVNGPYDIVICRNVLIYFDIKIQLQVIEKMLMQLHVGGYLILGHSELLPKNHNLPIEHIEGTIYKKI